MKIGLDVQLLTGGNKTGVRWCADNIVKELAKDKNYECELNFFSLRGDCPALNEYADCGAKKKRCVWFSGTAFSWISRVLPIPYSWFFGKDQRIVQFFNYAVPAGIKGKSVIIVYDMAYKACPDTVHERTRKWLERVLAVSCRRADVIVTISEFSKSEIIKYLGVPEEKIVVMPCGVDLGRYHARYPETAIASSKEKYKINERYLLYLGTLEPRKNLIKLIEAYHLLLQQAGKQAPKLVLAGGKGWYYDGIFKRVEELGIKDQVIFTDYVDNEDVALLMGGAEMFLFPSLYEGFGMPPLEAMACGTPVIVSNSTSLPEVVGDAGLLVDPDSPEDICGAMRKLLADEELRTDLTERGSRRAQEFTWERSVNVLKEVYRKLEEKNDTVGK